MDPPRPIAPATADAFRLERQALIERLRLRIGPMAGPYEDALRTVDRAEFADQSSRHLAWLDEPLPLRTPYGGNVATVSAPHMYVIMFAALGLAAGQRFLELGSGSGYGAALASAVVGPSGQVTTVEVDPYLAARTRSILSRVAPSVIVLEDDGLVRPDLLDGVDCCSVTFALDEVAPAFLARLSVGASLVAPVREREEQRLLLFRRHRMGLTCEDLGPVYFVASRTRGDLVLERAP